MNRYTCPADKLRCLWNACQIVSTMLQFRAEVLQDKDRQVGADLLLPSLIYLVLKHPPPRLYSNLRFCSDFARPSALNSEVGYVLINFMSAVSFARHSNPAEFRGSKTGAATQAAGAPPAADSAAALRDSGSLGEPPSAALVSASETATAGSSSAAVIDSSFAAVGPSRLESTRRTALQEQLRTSSLLPTAVQSSLLPTAVQKALTEAPAPSASRASSFLMKAESLAAAAAATLAASEADGDAAVGETGFDASAEMALSSPGVFSATALRSPFTVSLQDSLASSFVVAMTPARLRGSARTAPYSADGAQARPTSALEIRVAALCDSLCTLSAKMERAVKVLCSGR